MTIERVIIRRPGGKKRLATHVTTDAHTVLVFSGLLSDREALRRAMKYKKNPGEFNVHDVHGIERSISRYREFNREEPKRLRRIDLDLNVPLIRLGKVPVITYISRKEGRLQAYKHETKRMPTLYAHPSKPVFLMLGGSVRVRDWLYD